MVKNVELGQVARQKLYNGLKKSADTITVTMGVGGQTVAVINALGELQITKDGVTVAINLRDFGDPIEEIGNLILREASIKTAENAGDGTTTSTLLAYSLIREGLLALENDPSLSSNELLKGIEKASKLVVEYLETQKMELDGDNGKDLLEKVATLSANGDESIGKTIAHAVSEAGMNGLVSLKKGTGNSDKHRLEEVGGIIYNNGLKSGAFVTNVERGFCELKNPYIFITENPIEGEQAFVEFQKRILAPIVESHGDLLIICPNISDFALSNLVKLANHPNLVSKFCVTGIPYSGVTGQSYLDDLAVLTGGYAITARSGVDLATVTLNHCGSATKVIVDTRKTIIFDPSGDSTEEGVERIANRMLFLEQEISHAKSDVAKKHLIERKASLLGRTTMIHIEGLTPQELDEKFDRADDSLKACTCALKEGVISGGGTALLRATSHINFKDDKVFTTDGQIRGAKIVEKAIKEPFVKILSNVGIAQEEIFGLMYKLKSNDLTWEVYNPMTNETVDAIESGIIDPIMVTKVALKNAVSVAGTLLRTGGVIYTEVPDNIDESKLLNQY